MREFSEILKELLNINNINQRELSKLTGINETTISNYVNGKIKPTAYTENKIYNILGKPNYGSDVKMLTVKEVAKILKKSERFVQIGLQRGILPFGSAVKTSSRYTYNIPEPKFLAYLETV